ncbi:MAG: polysaccharide biosynthesis/export family protein [Candidatus Omnitrophota bacterium]
MRVKSKKIKFVLFCIIFSHLFAYTCAFAKTDDYKLQADKHYQTGLIFYNEGRYPEAEEEFQMAMEIIKQSEKAEAVLGADKEQVSQLDTKIKQDNFEYVIGEGDSLLIKVWQNPDLDSEVIVRPDGMVSFPLVGDIKVIGLKVSEFRTDLEEVLKEYVRMPQVSVSLTKIGGRRIIILGQVKSPGIYSVTGRRTILEAIGLAGGFTEDAVANSVILVKGGFVNPDAKRLDLNKALKKGDLKDNVLLESEDIIYVPRRFIADVNYFLKLILDPLSRGLYSVKEIRDW